MRVSENVMQDILRSLRCRVCARWGRVCRRVSSACRTCVVDEHTDVDDGRRLGVSGV